MSGKIDFCENEIYDLDKRILEAVARFGWCNQMKARAYVGELAWEVLERNGGWIKTCSTLIDRNVDVFSKRWLETAQEIICGYPIQKHTPQKFGATA